MKLILDEPAVKYIIQSYGTDYVTISGKRYNQNLVVRPERLITDGLPQRIEELTADHCAVFYPYNLDVVLIGAGAKIYFPPRAIFSPLEEQNIGVEIMDTGAACRTYNLLISENRRVAAWLFI